jgi:PKD repeat protein
MKKIYAVTIVLVLSFAGSAQLQAPLTEGTGASPDWTTNQTKALGDSCGAYFNNYIGLNKTTDIYFEALRTGTNPEYNTYGGRAQRFNAPQAIEISGIQFYAFETNPLVDSLMAITILHDYNSLNDSVGIELARDTIYVKHQAFTPVLPDIEVNSMFDTPVTVTNDYMISVITPTEDSLKIIVSSALDNDGNGEDLSYLIYNNPDFLSAAGYYNNFASYGLSYDLDYLISPRIEFDLHDEFTILDDSICPGLVSAGCVNYVQKPIYSDVQYNGFGATPSNHIQWLWGDGFQNTNLLTACHTYNNSGSYNIQLNDTLKKHDFFSAVCVGSVTKPITVLDEAVASFTFTQSGSIVDFTSTSTAADSLVWDFGDSTSVSDSISVEHTYDSLATYNVWLYAYNECGVDSVMMQVTTDDVGFEENDFNFKIYPNPAKSMTNVVGLKDGSKLEVINIVGKTVFTTYADNTNVQLELYNFSSGTYFIKVSTDEGQVTKKLVIRN